MKMVFWSSAEGYTTSMPLGYVQIGLTDSFARDYSGLSGGSEFSMNFNDQIADFANTIPVAKPASIGILGLKDSPGGALQVRVDGGKTTLCFPLGYETGEEELRKLVSWLPWSPLMIRKGFLNPCIRGSGKRSVWWFRCRKPLRQGA
jgi:hypothetical protein